MSHFNRLFLYAYTVNLMYKFLRYYFSLPGQMLSMWAARKPSAAIFSPSTEVEPMSLATMVLNRKYKRPARLTVFGDWKIQTANLSGCGQSRTCNLPVPQFEKPFLGLNETAINIISISHKDIASLVTFSRRIVQ